MSKWIVEVELQQMQQATYEDGSAVEIVIPRPSTFQVEMFSAGPMGPKGERGDPGDPNLFELEIDPVLLFENALI